jgi:hypothetical protein
VLLLPNTVQPTRSQTQAIAVVLVVLALDPAEKGINKKKEQ